MVHIEILLVLSACPLIARATSVGMQVDANRKRLVRLESISSSKEIATHAQNTNTHTHTRMQVKSAFARYVHHVARQPKKDLSSLMSHLPQVIYDMGIKTFGSKETLQSFLRTLSGPHPLDDDGFNLNLFSSAGDNTVKRLRKEMAVDEYGINKVQETTGLIVDVGGNIGDLAITAAKRHPQLQVLTLEPVPSTFFILMLNVYSNDVPMIAEDDLGKADKPGVLPLNKGLTSDGRDIRMDVNLNSTQDAHLVDSHVESLMEVSVGSLSFPRYLAAHDVEIVRLLKMDCEGCEFEAISSMQGFLEDKSKVERFSAEIHHFGDPTRTPTPNQLKVMDQVLLARGCNTYSEGWWEVKC